MSSASHVTHKGEKSGLWFSEFYHAVLHAVVYFIFGITVGLFLSIVAAPKLEHDHPYWARVCEHVGMGLIVAAWAVVAYEIGAHLKGVVNLSTRLTSIIEDRVATIAESVGKTALNNGLRELLVGNNETKPHVTEAISRCTDLVTALSNLERSRIWAHEQYVEFVSYLLKYVVDNAQTLQSLGHPEYNGEYFYSMPTSFEATGFILSNQMKALGPGDRYDVISDLASWDNEQLHNFRDSTALAIQKDGVEVIRIFNMRHSHDRSLARIRAREILMAHVKQSKELGFTEHNLRRYQVLVITEKELDQEPSDNFREQIRRAHFGIFTRRDHLRLRVQVPYPDLSRLILANKSEEVRRDYDLFKRALTIARPLIDSDQIESVLDDAGLK